MLKIRLRKKKIVIEINWPTKPKQTKTIGPFFKAISKNTIQVSRKASFIVLTLGKQRRGKWYQLTNNPDEYPLEIDEIELLRKQRKINSRSRKRGGGDISGGKSSNSRFGESDVGSIVVSQFNKIKATVGIKPSLGKKYSHLPFFGGGVLGSGRKRSSAKKSYKRGGYGAGGGERSPFGADEGAGRSVVGRKLSAFDGGGFGPENSEYSKEMVGGEGGGLDERKGVSQGVPSLSDHRIEDETLRSGSNNREARRRTARFGGESGARRRYRRHPGASGLSAANSRNAQNCSKARRRLSNRKRRGSWRKRAGSRSHSRKSVKSDIKGSVWHQRKRNQRNFDFSHYREDLSRMGSKENSTGKFGEVKDFDYNFEEGLPLQKHQKNLKMGRGVLSKISQNRPSRMRGGGLEHSNELVNGPELPLFCQKLKNRQIPKFSFFEESHKEGPLKEISGQIETSYNRIDLQKARWVPRRQRIDLSCRKSRASFSGFQNKMISESCFNKRNNRSLETKGAGPKGSNLKLLKIIGNKVRGLCGDSYETREDDLEVSFEVSKPRGQTKRSKKRFGVKNRKKIENMAKRVLSSFTAYNAMTSGSGIKISSQKLSKGLKTGAGVNLANYRSRSQNKKNGLNRDFQANEATAMALAATSSKRNASRDSKNKKFEEIDNKENFGILGKLEQEGYSRKFKKGLLAKEMANTGLEGARFGLGGKARIPTPDHSRSRRKTVEGKQKHLYASKGSREVDSVLENPEKCLKSEKSNFGFSRGSASQKLSTRDRDNSKALRGTRRDRSTGRKLRRSDKKFKRPKSSKNHSNSKSGRNGSTLRSRSKEAIRREPSHTQNLAGSSSVKKYKRQIPSLKNEIKNLLQKDRDHSCEHLGTKRDGNGAPEHPRRHRKSVQCKWRQRTNFNFKPVKKMIQDAELLDGIAEYRWMQDDERLELLNEVILDLKAKLISEQKTRMGRERELELMLQRDNNQVSELVIRFLSKILAKFDFLGKFVECERRHFLQL